MEKNSEQVKTWLGSEIVAAFHSDAIILNVNRGGRWKIRFGIDGSTKRWNAQWTFDDDTKTWKMSDSIEFDRQTKRWKWA